MNFSKGSRYETDFSLRVDNPDNTTIRASITSGGPSVCIGYRSEGDSSPYNPRKKTIETGTSAVPVGREDKQEGGEEE